MPGNLGRIVAVVDDLFFGAKITETARRVGVPVDIASSQSVLDGKLAQKPALIIVDLNLSAMEPLALIARLKADPDLKQASILAFLSHVQGELKLKAQKAGCDMVVARSSFSQNLPQILKRYGGQ